MLYQWIPVPYIFSVFMAWCSLSFLFDVFYPFLSCSWLPYFYRQIFVYIFASVMSLNRSCSLYHRFCEKIVFMLYFYLIIVVLFMGMLLSVYHLGLIICFLGFSGLPFSSPGILFLVRFCCLSLLYHSSDSVALCFVLLLFLWQYSGLPSLLVLIIKSYFITSFFSHSVHNLYCFLCLSGITTSFPYRCKIPVFLLF